MSLSRRQFIQASGIALCAGVVPLKPAQPGNSNATRSGFESRRGQPLTAVRVNCLGNQWSLHWADYPRRFGNGRARRCYELIYSNRLTEKCLNDGGPGTAR